MKIVFIFIAIIAIIAIVVGLVIFFNNNNTADFKAPGGTRLSTNVNEENA